LNKNGAISAPFSVLAGPMPSIGPGQPASQPARISLAHS
jgi:hypothetical protein